jgi:hypothetical protein
MVGDVKTEDALQALNARALPYTCAAHVLSSFRQVQMRCEHCNRI